MARGRALPYRRGLGDLGEGIADDERSRLIDEFRSQAKLDLPVDVVTVLADTFVDFGDEYLDGGVLSWKPGEVERFMTDWVHRKVVLDEPEMEALPDVLAPWIEFALGHKGIEPADIAVVVAEVAESRDEYEGLREDESGQGVAAQLMRSMQSAGVDLGDKEAVAQAVSAFNAQRMAELAAETRDGAT